MKTIGERVKVARELAHLTQETVEKKAKISQGLISGIESGKIQPTVIKWLKLIRAIGLPIDYFIPEEYKDVLGKK